MNNKLRKIKRIVGVSILSVFIFSFLHSELGLLNHNDDNHSSHDHCTIVNGSTTPANKTNMRDLIKVKWVIIIIPKIIEEEYPPSSAFYSETDNPYNTKKTNKVYLRNNFFLI
jgi:hypothetical protein